MRSDRETKMPCNRLTVPKVHVRKASKKGLKNVLLEALDQSESDQNEAEIDGGVAPGIKQWYRLVTAISAGPISASFGKTDTAESGDADRFLKKFSTQNFNPCQNGRTPPPVRRRWTNFQRQNSTFRTARPSMRKKFTRSLRKYVITPDGTFLFYWLALVSVAVCYNWWSVIIREAFTKLETECQTVWFGMDLLADSIFLLDIVRKIRTGYLEEGLVVVDANKLLKNYIFSISFLLDVLSLLPVKLVSDCMGMNDHPLMRFPRLIKTYEVLSFMSMIETRTMYPNLVRCTNLTHILLLTCHWFACFHFMIAKATGFQTAWSADWTETLVANMSTHRTYLLSVYWATLTLTTVGNKATPTSNWEYCFSIITYLIGVFTFATIVGQVGNVIANRNTSRLEFERLLDTAKQYMRHHRVPKPMQKRVQQWYDYSFSRGRMTDGSEIGCLSVLPDKLKTELSLHVNLDTLKKVSIFQECQPEFLHDLVLKMRAIIFTPGDIVCRKGEIAREMYIIADGVLEIIDENGELIHEMRSGDFFGEVGILNLDGGINKLKFCGFSNFELVYLVFPRRSADVRSVGYSELFSLTKEDVLAATKDYPEAEALLRQCGSARLARTKSRYNLRQTEGNPFGPTCTSQTISTTDNNFLSPTNQRTLNGQRKAGISINVTESQTKSSELKRTADKSTSTPDHAFHMHNEIRAPSEKKGCVMTADLSMFADVFRPHYSRAKSVRLPGKPQEALRKGRSLDSAMAHKSLHMRFHDCLSDVAQMADRLTFLAPRKLREDLKKEINVMNELFQEMKQQIQSHEEIVEHIRRDNSRLKYTTLDIIAIFPFSEDFSSTDILKTIHTQTEDSDRGGLPQSPTEADFSSDDESHFSSQEVLV